METPYCLTTSAEMLSRMNRLARSRSGYSLAVEIRASRQVDRVHAASEDSRKAVLPLPAVLNGACAKLASSQFKGKSRIGNYGDKMMEGDYHVGQILDTLKELGVDDNTIVVFASDNGPYGEAAREFGNQGTPDMGNSGPFRGELGKVTEGSIRTAAII